MAKRGSTKIISMTGGPCSGKTTLLNILQQELEDHGVRLFRVPEAARHLMEMGIYPNPANPLSFQRKVLQLQIKLEKLALEAAREFGGDALILCDRGTMDVKAYLKASEFKKLLKQGRHTVTMLRDKRYDAIIHLVTAANGASEFYVCDANRRETKVQAIARDTKTRDAWVGHPHLQVIDNTTDMEGKKQRALEAILHVLGKPIPLEIERKFRVGKFSRKILPAHAVGVDIEQIYIGHSADHVERIRKRGRGDDAVYFHTVKRSITSATREETEWQISAREYQALSTRRLPGTCVIRKRRWCFLYENQYFEFDDLRPMNLDFCLVEIELTNEEQKIILPTWMRAAQDVTDDSNYSNFGLACTYAHEDE